MTNCYATYPGFPEIIYRLQDLDRPKIKDLSFMEVKLNKDNLWLIVLRVVLAYTPNGVEITQN